MSVTNNEVAVRKALDDLINAMLAGDKADLEARVADQLTFGHVNGHIHNKTEFVSGIASKRAVYKAINFIEQPTVTVIGNTAVVRYSTATEVEAGGNPISMKLVVLHAWVKDGDAWKLLAHQGTKLS
jgi:ketosteroid isomerase-like protein